MSFRFEPLAEDHRTAVIDIFNHFATRTFAASFDEALPYTFFDRVLEMTRGYPALAVRDESGQVVGRKAGAWVLQVPGR